MKSIIKAPFLINVVRLIALCILIWDIAYYCRSPGKGNISALVLFVAISAASLLSIILTCFHSKWALWSLALLYVISPLCVWILVDTWILHASGWWDWVEGIALQMCAPCLFSLCLITAKNVRIFYGYNELPWRRLLIELDTSNVRITLDKSDPSSK